MVIQSKYVQPLLIVVEQLLNPLQEPLALNEGRQGYV
jgi:hypothetical protein